MQLSCYQSLSAPVLRALRLALEGTLTFHWNHVATVLLKGMC